MIIWIDGALDPVDAARIDPRDRGFTLGDGLYETIRVKNGALLRIDRHFARLSDGMQLLDFPLSVDETALTAAMQAVLVANGLENAAVRLTISRGVAARGLVPDPAAKPTVAISAAPYTAPTPARVMIATVTRRNAASPLSRVKSTCCLDSILARIEAGRQGFDDAILLNGAVGVAEATAANVFAVIDGTLTTPPVADGALPGVMRESIMALRPVTERSLTPDELVRANEIFLTSSLGIRPVVALGDQALGIGPVARGLMAIL